MKLSKALTALCFTLIAIFFFSIHFSISGDSNKEEYWMGIYSGDDRIGYSYNSTQQDKDLTKVLEFTSLSINLLGKESEVKSRGSYILEGYKIISFEYEMNSDDLDFKATGKRAGGNLQITLETVSGKSRRTVPVKEELILPSMVSKIMVDDDMKTGDTFKFILFEPLSILMGVNEPVSTNTVGQRETVKLRKGEFWAYKVESNFMGSEITLWIDDEGDVIKQEFPPGLTSIKESKEEILSNNSVSFDIVSETSIHSDSELKDPGSLKHMKVKLGGIDVSNGLDINDGYRQ
jgi:hypothetical protein